MMRICYALQLVPRPWWSVAGIIEVAGIVTTASLTFPPMYVSAVPASDRNHGRDLLWALVIFTSMFSISTAAVRHTMIHMLYLKITLKLKL